jgi:lysine-ketoglutarate reductase/saccharopine dehydrogenase-like protein (TIGR00300 family)
VGFQLPEYRPPDFHQPTLAQAPLAEFHTVVRDGVAPDNYHATSIFPEYLHLAPGVWVLAAPSRMDCVIVRHPDDTLEVKEFRRLQQGERVAIGRTENGEQGIWVHTEGFATVNGGPEKFAFRMNRTRETSFSIDYDQLYALLRHEKEHGNVVWVLGPAVVFDFDARAAFCALIEEGFVDALLAGNALATHDIEAALFGTALGQELYSKQPVAQGHYKHLDALNQVRGLGSMKRAVQGGMIASGVMQALIKREIPFVLAGSIRDDGPMPEVVADAYLAQDRMRAVTARATTIIALATQLHTIATGNLSPSFILDSRSGVRPVYFYSVDMSEFAVNKLSDRGSLSARSILTNVQDFVVTLHRGLQG